MLGRAGLLVIINGTLLLVSLVSSCSFKASFLDIPFTLRICSFTKSSFYPRFVR